MKDLRTLTISDYVNILWRRRWYIVIGFVLVSGAAAVYGYQAKNVYKSQSTIMVESAAIPQDYVRSASATVEEQVATIRQTLQSRSFLEKVVQDSGLPESLIKGLGNSIGITSTSRNTIVISCAAGSAQIARDMTQNVVNALIKDSSTSKKDRANEADAFLAEQLRQTERGLQDQEELIKKFKLDHLESLPEQTAANLSALTALNTQLASVENAIQNAKNQLNLLEFRVQEQKKLGTLARNLTTPAPKPATAGKESRPVVSSPALAAKQAELRALTSRYTPSHPDVIRVSRELEELKRQLESGPLPDPNAAAENADRAAAPMNEPVFGTDLTLDVEAAQLKVESQAIKNDIAKRENDKKSILSQIAAYQGRLKMAPALEQEFMTLSRTHDALREEYRNLQSKKSQTRLTADLEKDDKNDTYRIIDPADLPAKPAFPDRKEIILIGLAGGLAVGIGAAFGRELLDSTLGSEDEVVAVLKLPALVTISEIPAQKKKGLLGFGRTAKSA